MGFEINHNETDPMERVYLYRLDDALLAAGYDKARKLFAEDRNTALARILELPFGDDGCLDMTAISGAQRRSSTEYIIIALAVMLAQYQDGIALAEQWGFGESGVIAAAASRFDSGNWSAFAEVMRLYRPSTPLFDRRR